MRITDVERDKTIRNVTLTGLVVNVLLAAVKFTAGFSGGSRAVVADAVHSLSDMTTDLAILLGMRYWNKPADSTHPYGHQRIETLVTLSIGLALGVVAIGMIWHGIVGLRSADHGHPELIALLAAALSVVCKEILYRWTAAAGRRVRSGAMIANAWHHRSDAFSSIPVVLAVGIATLVPSWEYLDHIGEIVVSLIILQAAAKICRPALAKLSDGGAPEATVAAMLEAAEATPGVCEVHKLRTRYVGCSTLAIDLHIEVDPNMSVLNGHLISENVCSRLLSSNPDVVDVVVHLEPHPLPAPGATASTAGADASSAAR